MTSTRAVAAGVEVALDFIAAFWDRPCYDWWEENRAAACLHAGRGSRRTGRRGKPTRARHGPGRACQAGSRADPRPCCGRRVVDDHLTKWLGSTAVDASLCAAIVPFGLVEMSTPVATGTLTEVTQQLCVDGGVHRFSADVFYGVASGRY